MPLWIAELCEGATSRWILATPTDYTRILLLIIVLGWFLSRQHLSKA